jgi:hypothetical protein
MSLWQQLPLLTEGNGVHRTGGGMNSKGDSGRELRAPLFLPFRGEWYSYNKQTRTGVRCT